MKEEKDALAFLALLSRMYLTLDAGYKHDDGEWTHANGLNIHAIIVDNTDGEILGRGQNKIHEFTDPMMHAEQAALREAIKKINEKRPRDPKSSVENYYRKRLFNDADPDNLNKGATLYTTLEPCPFCSAALLVTRMKRVVYITPDAKYGKALQLIKFGYYPSYDITCERLTLHSDLGIVGYALKLYTDILSKTEALRNRGILDIHFYDHMKDELKEVHDYFVQLKESELSGNEKNVALWKELRAYVLGRLA